MACESAKEVGQKTVLAECRIDAGSEEAQWHMEYKKVGSSAWTSTPGGRITGTKVVKETLNLDPATEYVYRGVATDTQGQTRSAHFRFTTLPAVEAGPCEPTDVGATSVLFEGMVNPEGLATDALYEYGFTTGYEMRQYPRR